jgi:hypothetical protein
MHSHDPSFRRQKQEDVKLGGSETVSQTQNENRRWSACPASASPWVQSSAPPKKRKIVLKTQVPTVVKNVNPDHTEIL